MDYLFKYMLLSFSLCCARTIQASRDDSSRHNDCDLMCGDRRCFLDRIPNRCVCPNNFVERDGVCWEVAQPQDRVQDSKNEDKVWNIDGQLDAIREETHHNKDEAENVPKQFRVLDTNKEQIKDIQLQVKEENHSSDPQAAPHASSGDSSSSQNSDAGITTVVFIAVVAGCSVAGLMGLVVAGVCWYRLQKNVKAASEAEYPAYGVTGPAHEKAGSPGDRKLAQSAQMYHYQHQKQQMLAMERAQGELGGNGSDVDSEEEEEGADYTVYECPGLAPTGEMEVKNPLFNDDTPVGPGGSNNEESTQHKQ